MVVCLWLEKKDMSLTPKPFTHHLLGKGFTLFREGGELFLIGGEFNNVSFEVKLKQKKVFEKSTGTIWHHRPVKEKDVLKKHGCWVKTDIAVWRKAFQKIRLQRETEAHFKGFRPQRFGPYTKDDLEVFFDEKI